MAIYWTKNTIILKKKYYIFLKCIQNNSYLHFILVRIIFILLFSIKFFKTNTFPKIKIWAHCASVSARFHMYKMEVAVDDLSKVMDPTSIPAGIGIRPYWFKKSSSSNDGSSSWLYNVFSIVLSFGLCQKCNICCVNYCSIVYIYKLHTLIFRMSRVYYYYSVSLILYIIYRLGG